MIDRIHLIGNSPILSGSGLGEEIDSCPVVRINTAPTSGYGEDVGRRTDARVVCGNLQMGRHDEWLSTLSGETLILYPTPEDIRKNAQRLTSADNSLRYLHGEAIEAWTKFLDESPLEERPTSGLYGAWFLSKIAEQVHLYGFGFYESTESHYYYKDVKVEANGHEPQVEKLILKNMDDVALKMPVDH
ncbi:glycosyltransferase family 29 protein [Salinibacter sp.]|uniref:glycosyltransferase family 29 protein n=1 Tax=Salinibacter sp. TaxID=2065818 RepID=UPI0021E8CF67|nr:glycosyltransferase family 29 protein [Salinibacter sp.]